jgi:hypothetical protein
MLNSIQHLTRSRAYEILKQVQDDKIGLFTRPSKIIHDNTLLKIKRMVNKVCPVFRGRKDCILE